MINQVVLVGRLTKDVDLRYAQSGKAVGKFTLAVNRRFTGSSGEREADFIRCTTWGKNAENAANFLRKGSLAGVVGDLRTGSYEGQDGKRVYTTEVNVDQIQFLEPKGARNDNGGSMNQGGYNPPPANDSESFWSNDAGSGDDLPF